MLNDPQVGDDIKSQLSLLWSEFVIVMLLHHGGVNQTINAVKNKTDKMISKVNLFRICN